MNNTCWAVGSWAVDSWLDDTWADIGTSVGGKIPKIYKIDQIRPMSGARPA
jgi:hypothetical protein